MKPGITIISFLAAYTLLLSAAIDAGAQIHCRIDTVRYVPGIVTNAPNRVDIIVRDSASKAKLPEAVVMLYDGRDTLKMQTYVDGSVFVDSKSLASDSVFVKAMYMGFKERSGYVRINRRYRSNITIDLAEDPMELASIVVVGDAVAMVMLGDTTVFNSTAYSTMKGDVLRDLLGRFPGVSLSDGGISYKGRKIDRILVNGTSLFGSDMKSAMDMVLAKEVKSVKVYDRTAADDLTDDGTEAKEHVMDVHTWDPLKHVGQLSLSAEGGLYTGKNPYGAHDYLANGSVSIGDFYTGARPGLSADVTGAHNLDPRQKPSENLHANIRINGMVSGKSGHDTMISLNMNKIRSESGSVTDYMPSYAWTERSDTASSTSSTKSEELMINHYEYKKIGGLSYKGTYRAGLSRHSSGLRNIQSSLQDNVLTGFNKAVCDTATDISLLINPAFDKKFGKSRRTLYISPKFSVRRSSGSGSRLDTLKTSMSSEWLVHTLFSSKVTPSLSVSWIEPVSKNSLLSARANVEYNYGVTRKLYTDMLTGAPDVNNSRNFTTDNVSARVAAEYRYGRIGGEGFYLDCLFGAKDIYVNRNERTGGVKNWRGNYLRPDISAMMAWAAGEHQLSFKYNESEAVPAVEQLRNTVDDANPLYLYSGNPELKMSVSRHAALVYGFSVVERGLVVKMELSGSVTSDVISQKTTYFPEESYVPSIDYTVAKGAALTMPMNVPLAYDLMGRISYDQYLARPKAKLEVSGYVNYSYSPFYLADELRHNTFFAPSLSVDLTKSSDSAFFVLAADVNAGRSMCDDELMDMFVMPKLHLEYRKRIGNHFEIHTQDRIEWMISRNSTDYCDIDARLALSWIFGKDSRCRASVFGRNLADSISGTKNTAEADYVRTSWDRSLGRSVGLSFTYVFSRR